MPQANPVMAPPPPPPLPPTSTAATKKKASPPASSSSSPSSSSSTSPSVSPSTSSGAVPTKAAANPQLPPLVPVYTKPAILGLPPTAVLTKQEMDFRANLLNPNNDLFWTARGLIRPPVLADALAQGHAILKYEGHLTQKQGGRRLSAQYGRSGATSAAAAGMPLSFGAAVVTPTSVTAAVQGSWRSPAPVLPTNPGFVTKEDMDIRANQLNPNNDVFWSSRGLIRPAVLADALAQGHAILQQEGHLTQTQTHKTRGRLNSQPSLYSNSDLGGRPADTRRSISGQGLPGSGSGGIGSGAGRISGSRAGDEQQPMAMRRRASTTGSIMNRPPALDGSVTKDEVDLRANLMNPNNSIFWTSRGLTRPADLQEALAKGHAVLEAEGHITHNTGGGRSKSWNRRGSRTELHGPPSVSPLVAAAQRQWSTPFLAPNAGITAMPPTSLSARPGGLPGAAWVAGPPSAPGAASTRHPDWQPNAPQRRRYSLPPPGFELFTPPSHFALFRPPMAAQQKPLQPKQAMPFAGKEGAADSEWDKMDAEALNRPLAPHSAAIPIVKPTAADIAAAKKNEGAWVKKAPSADSKKSTGVFLRNDKSSTKEEKDKAGGEDKKKIEAETKAMKQEDKKESTASSDDSTKSDVETRDAVIPSEPTTPATAAATTSTSTSDKVGSLAWQLTQVKLRTRRPSEARESDISTKSATA